MDRNQGPAWVSRQASLLLELGKPVGNRTRPTWGRGTKTRLPSKLHGSQRRFLFKEFPDLSLGSEGVRSWDTTESLGAHVPNSFLRGDQKFNSQQDPSPTLGLGAIPPAPSRSGCRNRGGNGGGEALAQVLSTPPPHWPPSSGPSPPEQQEWGPACGKERKGRWGVSWSSRGKGLAPTVSSCNPPHLLSQPWRREEESRRVLKALFCEWDEGQLGSVG